jgi:hypothetical protein
MTSQWQLYREPLRVTMLRTGMIAIVVGAVRPSKPPVQEAPSVTIPKRLYAEEPRCSYL